ncbi:MAG: methionyl-tRNA formyltransferase [Acidobacteriia bacterium]|nr:methionyl-tRNA formyltransferase [Terriglobia bacterium]
MNLIFCGTPEFAVPTLEKLLAEGFQIDLVVSQPDEPSGRGYEVKPPPVKIVAERAGIPVFQPAKLKIPATQEFLSRYHPDAIVVVAYGRIIPPWMIDLPRLGCINLHASLLPKYRGAAPIQWAMMRGETVTGVTTMKIDPGMDTGDILLAREIPIREEDTTETLSKSLSAIGADLMVETLRRLERGEITPRPQDHSQATMAPMLKKEDGRIDWNLLARAISWRVRGLRPWPGAYTTFRGKNLHVWSAAVANAPASDLVPGTLLGGGRKLSVVCGQGTQLELKEVQLEGRKRLSTRDFLNGVRLAPGEKLGP